MMGLVLLLTTLTTGPALAGQTEVGTLYTTLSVADVQGMLDSMMLTNVRADGDDTGPAWQLTLGDMETVLFLDDCDGPTCGSVQLWAGFSTGAPVSLDALNTWNREHRFTRAYVTDAGVVHLESDLDLTGGTSLRAVVEQIRVFRASTLAFSEHLSPAPATP
jgi:hypothetical protein